MNVVNMLDIKALDEVINDLVELETQGESHVVDQLMDSMCDEYRGLIMQRLKQRAKQEDCYLI